LAQLEERAANHARRERIVARFMEGLAGLQTYLQLPAARPDTEHARMFFPIVVRDRMVSRDSLVRHLEDHAIETRFLLPLINQPLYRRLFGNLDASYPVAAHLNDHAFYIGCHPEMADDDVEYVIDCIHRFFRTPHDGVRPPVAAQPRPRGLVRPRGGAAVVALSDLLVDPGARPRPRSSTGRRPDPHRPPAAGAGNVLPDAAVPLPRLRP